MAEAGPSPRPLLFRPPPRWHVWAALGGALLIHIGAVVAAMKHEQPPANLEDIPSAVVEATMEAAPEPTPPPEEIITATPPPEPEATPEYVEERTPPPKQPRLRRSRRRWRQDARGQCRSPPPKRSPPMRPARPILMKHVHDMSPEAAFAWSTSILAAAA